MKAVLMVIGVTALACLAGKAMDLPGDTLFFFVGGSLLLATLATLAFDRLVLRRYEHLLFPSDTGQKLPLHSRLHAKINGLDRWTLFLTIGLIIYSCIYAAYLVFRLYEAVLHDLIKLLPHL